MPPCAGNGRFAYRTQNSNAPAEGVASQTAGGNLPGIEENSNATVEGNRLPSGNIEAIPPPGSDRRSPSPLRETTAIPLLSNDYLAREEQLLASTSENLIWNIQLKRRREALADGVEELSGRPHKGLFQHSDFAHAVHTESASGLKEYRFFKGGEWPPSLSAKDYDETVDV